MRVSPGGSLAVPSRLPFTPPLHFTARIRRMTGGYIFSLSTLVGAGGSWSTPSQVWPGGGGVPHPRSGQGGIPSQVLGGVLHFRSGVPPQPGVDGGYPGYPSSTPGRGVPQVQSLQSVPWVPPYLGWGTPPRPGTEYPPT